MRSFTVALLLLALMLTADLAAVAKFEKILSSIVRPTNISPVVIWMPSAPPDVLPLKVLPLITLLFQNVPVPFITIQATTLLLNILSRAEIARLVVIGMTPRSWKLQ